MTLFTGYLVRAVVLLALSVVSAKADEEYGLHESSAATEEVVVEEQHSSHSTRLHKLNAAICVVGQVARMEIETKIENLIQANLVNADMHLFLILQEGEGRFTNGGATACEVAPSSLEDAVSRFTPYVNTTGVVHQFKKWDVNADSWPGFPLAGEEKVSRLQNYINQFLTWRTCAEAVSEYEVENNMQFHAVLRLRDNSLVLGPFNLLKKLVSVDQRVDKAALAQGAGGGGGRIHKGQQHGVANVVKASMLISLPVISKECASWGGVNDKAMLIPRKHMDKALRGPADQFYLTAFNSTHPWKIKNTERYVKDTFFHLWVPQIVEDRDSAFPITDGRCEDGKSFCVVAEVKDCRPKNIVTHSVAVSECKKNYLDVSWERDRKTKLEQQQQQVQAATASTDNAGT